MVSFNNLTISGIVYRFREIPERNYSQFILIHNIGGRRQPLFLKCNLPKESSDKIKEGDTIRVDAFLRPFKAGIIAKVKSFTKS